MAPPSENSVGMAGLKGIADEHELHRYRAPRGHHTFAHYIDSRLDIVGHIALREPGGRTSEGKKIRQTLVKQHIMEDPLLHNLWKSESKAETQRLLAGPFLSNKLGALRLKNARARPKAASTVSDDSHTCKKETPDTIEHSTDVIARSDAEVAKFQREHTSLFVADTPTPDVPVQDSAPRREKHQAVPGPFKSGEDLGTSVLSGKEFPYSDGPTTLGTERHSPVAPMIVPEKHASAPVHPHLATPMTTPIQRKAPQVLKAQTITPQSHAQLQPAPDISASGNDKITTSPSTTLSLEETATLLSLNSPQVSTAYKTMDSINERLDTSGNARLDDAGNDVSTGKRAREKGINSPHGMPEAKYTKLDDVKIPEHTTHASLSDSREWLCLVERLSDTGTVQPGTTESILFDNVPTLDEIWSRIEETSEFGNAAVDRILFGDVFAERRITVALTSKANVKT